MKDALPPAILSRRKMGFPVPVGAWFRGPYRHLVEDCVLGERARGRGLFTPQALTRIVREHDAREVDHSERLWALVNLELWQRIFLDGEEAGEIGLEAPALAAAR
jgi:asparagine synthase (glutamine-hydrolysing)